LIQDEPNLVVLTVPDEMALIELSQRVKAADVRLARFNEADFGDEFTAFATEPINGAKRRLFAKLPLLK
jgi:hypothetical protein